MLMTGPSLNTSVYLLINSGMLFQMCYLTVFPDMHQPAPPFLPYVFITLDIISLYFGKIRDNIEKILLVISWEYDSAVITPLRNFCCLKCCHMWSTQCMFFICVHCGWSPNTWIKLYSLIPCSWIIWNIYHLNPHVFPVFFLNQLLLLLLLHSLFCLTFLSFWLENCSYLSGS